MTLRRRQMLFPILGGLGGFCGGLFGGLVFADMNFFYALPGGVGGMIGGAIGGWLGSCLEKPPKGGK